MTTAVEIRAPAEQTEGTRSQVLRWLKNVGESVAENEPLIEIETDKVTVEVASPGSGILREIVKGEQEEIIPGELLGRIESSRTAAATSDDLQTNALRGDGAAGSDASRSLSGSDTTGRRATGATSARSALPDAASQNASNLDSASFAANPGAATRLSPAVRRLLSQNSLDP